MPTLIFIAGPNGAGKTTFANEFLTGAYADYAFINADEIARELSTGGHDNHRDIRAARRMLRRLNQAIAAGQDIVVETTLATRTYAAKIPQWQKSGYFVNDYLSSAAACSGCYRARPSPSRGGRTRHSGGHDRAAVRFQPSVLRDAL